MSNHSDLPNPLDSFQDSPRHGFQGDRGVPPAKPRIPGSLTVALFHETGARGTAIAHRLGEKLGWQVFTQDLLEHSSQDELVRQEILEGISPESMEWVENRLGDPDLWQNPSQHPAVLNLVRLVLALGTQGEVILIGGGAGYILPRRSTLHVRLIASLEDRVAYLSQWLRMTHEEAARQVELRDQRRTEFIETHFNNSPGDAQQFDLLLNTSYLGEDLCSELIRLAARNKLSTLIPHSRDHHVVESDFLRG